MEFHKKFILKQEIMEFYKGTPSYPFKLYLDITSNAGVPWESKYYGDVIPGGIKPQEFDYFHMLILISEICKATSAGFFWGFAE